MVIKSSGKLGASGLIFTGPCHLIGVSYTADTATETTITVYDSITAANTAIAFLMPSDEVHTINIMFPGKGVPCSAGLYASMSAETGDYIIYYSL